MSWNNISILLIADVLQHNSVNFGTFNQHDFQKKKYVNATLLQQIFGLGEDFLYSALSESYATMHADPNYPSVLLLYE